MDSLFDKQVNPGIFQFFQSTVMPRMGEKEYLKAYRGWVYACTNAISERLADIELHLEKKTKVKGKIVWERVEEDASLDVLYHVNDFMTFYDLIFHTAAMLELDGNAFWYVVHSGQNGTGKPQEIWPMDPTRMNVIKDAQNFISGYVFINELGAHINFGTNEIVHFKKFNPNDKYRGMGTVAAAALAIDTDTYASEWQRNFFGNSAMPSGILTSDGPLTQKQYNRLKSNWDAKFKGVQNAHKMAILESGMKYTPLTPTAREMQFSDSRKNVRDEILSIFKVPKIILGITEDVNFASADKAEYVFSKFTIKPKMKHLVHNLDENFLPLFGLSPRDWRIVFEDPVPENIEQQVLVRESGVKNGYLTINEARAEVGKEALPGGDVLLVPNTMVPIASAGLDTRNDPNGGGDNADAGKHEHHHTTKALPPHKERKIKVNVQKKVARRVVYTNNATNKLHSEYLKLNSDLKVMLLKNLNKKSARLEWTKVYKANDIADAVEETPVSDLAKKLGLSKTEAKEIKHKKDAGSIIDLVFAGLKTWAKLVEGTSKEHMSSIMADSGAVAIAETGVDVSFDLENPRAVKWVKDHALEDSTSYSDTMKSDISDVISAGVDAGDTIDEISGGISQFFEDQSDFRAMRIARTEVIDSYAAGSMEGYRQSGVVVGKEWLLGGDNDSCDICEENAAAGTIDLDAAFPSGDDAPTAHPNCECDIQPVVEGDEDY